MQEHDSTLPKPLVEVGGNPILWHVMKIFSHWGYRDFVLCVGCKKQAFYDYFTRYRALHSPYTVRFGKRTEIQFHGAVEERGWEVTVVDTGVDTMTGARIARVSEFLDGTFLVTYADGLANINLEGLLQFHREHGGCATVTAVRPPGRFGIMQLVQPDRSSRVNSFFEKPATGTELINGGFFVFEKRFISEYLRPDANCILEREPLEQCARDRQLFAYAHTGSWQCMDTPMDWMKINAAWENGNAPWKMWK